MTLDESFFHAVRDGDGNGEGQLYFNFHRLYVPHFSCFESDLTVDILRHRDAKLAHQQQLDGFYYYIHVTVFRRFSL